MVAQSHGPVAPRTCALAAKAVRNGQTKIPELQKQANTGSLAVAKHVLNESRESPCQINFSNLKLLNALPGSVKPPGR